MLTEAYEVRLHVCLSSSAQHSVTDARTSKTMNAGQPSTYITEENVEKICQIVRGHLRVSE